MERKSMGESVLLPGGHDMMRREHEHEHSWNRNEDPVMRLYDGCWYYVACIMR